MEDWSCLFVLVHVQSVRGTTPGSAAASYRWTGHLTPHRSEFHPEAQLAPSMQGESRQWLPLSSPSAGRAGCLHWVGPPLLDASEAQAEDLRAGSFPWPVVSFASVLDRKPRALLWLKPERGQYSSVPHPKPTRTKVDLTLVPSQSLALHLGTPV